jgi:type IV secretory pathway VirJ component
LRTLLAVLLALAGVGALKAVGAAGQALPIVGPPAPAGPPTQETPKRRLRPRRVLADLPLVEVHPAAGPKTALMAVLLTGDGGWAVTDKGLSAALAAHGMPVLGWNSLRYFLHPRNPDGTTRDLERILRHYLPVWHREKVVLIGYSFGADVMPFLAHRLPPDLRARIALVALLGPDEKAGFRFHLAEWLGKDSKDTLPVRPELETLRGLPLLCSYGEAEEKSLCRELDPSLAHIHPRPGNHIVGKNYGKIVEEILQLTGLPVPAGAGPGRGKGASRP